MLFIHNLYQRSLKINLNSFRTLLRSQLGAYKPEAS